MNTITSIVDSVKIFGRVIGWVFNMKRYKKSFHLTNQKFARLGGNLDKIVTASVQKYNVIIPHLNMTM